MPSFLANIADVCIAKATLYTCYCTWFSQKSFVCLLFSPALLRYDWQIKITYMYIVHTVVQHVLL